MTTGKCICLLLAFVASTSAFSVSHTSHNAGRKLFGGYRIVPKVCQPTNPSRIKSNDPPICMFNYECSRRKGEVVGACMDGFLFGACCQLPALEKSPVSPNPLSVYEIDHAPDIPILLNSDGTPVGVSNKHPFATTGRPQNVKLKDKIENAEKTQLAQLEQNFPSLLAQQQVLDDLNLPSLLAHSDSNNDIHESVSPVSTLLNPNEIMQIDGQGFFSHKVNPNNSTGPDTILLNENGTALNETHNPDELFKPDEHFVSSTKYGYNPTSSFPTSVTQKLPSSAYTQLYANLDKLNEQNFEKSASTTQERLSSKASQIQSTTPMSGQDDLVRVPIISPTANKKNDNVMDNEEIAIHHIISILNDTSPNASTKVMTRDSTTPTSTIHKWVTIEDSSSRPITNKIVVTRNPSSTWSTTEKYPYTFYSKSPSHSSTYYYYSTGASTEPSASSSYQSSRPAVSSYTKIPTQSGSHYQGSSTTSQSRPTTNPPAPTVIVLGPIGTEYSTVATQPTFTHRPMTEYNVTDVTLRPVNITRKPTISTTITHNISTVISGTSSNHVVSNSYVSVNLKDVTTKPNIIKDTTGSYQATSTKKPSTFWTTVSSWSKKPSFQLKPGQNVVSTIVFKDTVTSAPSSSTSPCDDETTAPLDFVNFPPVRHPELNTTQEKPTQVDGYNSTRYPGVEIVGDNEIPTPTFVEDDALNNKVDGFVNDLVESLQGNFAQLKDVIYNKKNGTTIVLTTNAGVKKPSTPAPTRKPISTTRKPVTGTRKPTARPASSKPTVSKRPATVATTKKPGGATKRPRPTKPSVTIITDSVVEDTSFAYTTTESADLGTVIPPSDFRAACGLRPHMKTGRIVGGKGAKFGEWPWQVLVREATWLGLFTKNKCGGVLITDKYVITAAHCQPGFLASLVAVFGEYDISGELESKRSVTKNVRRVIVNRGYDPATFENDLALLELESPIQFDTHIVPICMPEDNSDYTGSWATVTGWGRLKYNGGVPSVLQEVKVPIMENSVCQEMFQTAGHSKLILDSFLCAGFANGQKDSCEGDSGGPLTIQRPDGRWVLVGTVSHGIKCAAPYLPGVYMKTTFFKPWLHSITGV